MSPHPERCRGPRRSRLLASCANEQRMLGFLPRSQHPGACLQRSPQGSLAHAGPGPLTALAVRALPAVPAGAEVAPAPQDAGALVHARAGSAEVHGPAGFCKKARAQEAQPGSAPKTPPLRRPRAAARPLRKRLTGLSADVGLGATGEHVVGAPHCVASSETSLHPALPHARGDFSRMCEALSTAYCSHSGHILLKRREGWPGQVTRWLSINP